MACGQQLRNCIPVGIHLNLIRGTRPRINQSQCSFCCVKVWLYNNKHLMTCSKGNSRSCFSEIFNVSPSRRNKTHCFPRGQSCVLLYIPTNSKLETTAKSSLALRPLAHKFTAVLRSTTSSAASWQFMLFPLGASEFCLPQALSEFWPMARDTVSSKTCLSWEVKQSKLDVFRTLPLKLSFSY